MSLLIQEEAYACASDSGSLRGCTHETGLGYSYVETRSTSKNIPVTAGRIPIWLLWVWSKPRMYFLHKNRFKKSSITVFYNPISLQFCCMI